MYEYVCYTKQGNWRFYADSDIDAMRLSLFYCWRDNEDFIKVECNSRQVLYAPSLQDRQD